MPGNVFTVTLWFNPAMEVIVTAFNMFSKTH